MKVFFLVTTERKFIVDNKTEKITSTKFFSTKDGVDSYLEDCKRKEVTVLSVEKYIQVEFTE